MLVFCDFQILLHYSIFDDDVCFIISASNLSAVKLALNYNLKIYLN